MVLSLLFLITLFTVNSAGAIDRLAFRGASGFHPWGRTPLARCGDFGWKSAAHSLKAF
jgi:hypothetical protein